MLKVGICEEERRNYEFNWSGLSGSYPCFSILIKYTNLKVDLQYCARPVYHKFLMKSVGNLNFLMHALH